jgi:hypothetical protein
MFLQALAESASTLLLQENADGRLRWPTTRVANGLAKRVQVLYRVHAADAALHI